jgi:hypothetical protein
LGHLRVAMEQGAELEKEQRKVLKKIADDEKASFIGLICNAITLGLVLGLIGLSESNSRDWGEKKQ